jgi:hypothetical protein
MFVRQTYGKSISDFRGVVAVRHRVAIPNLLACAVRCRAMNANTDPKPPSRSDKVLAWLQRNAGKSITIGFALYVGALALLHYAPTPAWLTAARGFAIDKLGPLGDSFGPLTAIFAAIAAVGAWRSYATQREQLEHERERADEERAQPIIATMIRTHGGGNVATIYDLVVLNDGNRPAVDVRLIANEAELVACLVAPDLANADNAAWRGVLRCFEPDSVIPLLPQGDEAKNSFGYSAQVGSSKPFWKYRSLFTLRVVYSDLEGRTYESKQVLTIRDSRAFADGRWSNQNESES